MMAKKSWSKQIRQSDFFGGSRECVGFRCQVSGVRYLNNQETTMNAIEKVSSELGRE